MDSIPQKTCPKCGTQKPLTAYYKDRKRYDGVQSWCKACCQASDAARKPKAAPRPESIRARLTREAAERRAEQAALKEQLRAAPTKVCPKCGIEKPKADYTVDTRYNDGCYPYCADCRREWRGGRIDKQRELHQNWVDQNRDHVREEANKWYAEHRDQELTKRRVRLHDRWHNDPIYRARKNREKKERYHSNPDFRRRRRAWSMITSHVRRARVKGTNTRFTQAEWRALCEKYGNHCLCCGEVKPLTPDHVVPISRGGSNAIENLQPLCLDCNLRKNAKTIDYRPEWDA